MPKDIVLEGKLSWWINCDDFGFRVGDDDIWEAVFDATHGGEYDISGGHPHVRLTIEFLEEPCVES